MGPTLIIVQDMDGTIFGGFASESWQISAKYYGTGEAFLFTFKDGEYKAYHWTRQNEYFQLSKENAIAFGGGGDFGLYLDKEFHHGSSAPAATFGNENLAKQKNFTIYAVEAWGVQDSSSRSRFRGTASTSISNWTGSPIPSDFART
eukprot:GEZU01021266.1.p2 GENE.GEZU01021266.1~~GEZU01021266.1.p2  ORF type:complete len:147 (+),score=31.58 GEZU01021266.1:140-580(+)